MIRKAVIPAAGFGTRLLPATKSQPKEMLPIVDMPVIQYVVEEAVAAGITDILMIIGKGKRAIEEHFDRNFELETVLQQKNKTEDLETIKRISQLADIHFIWQKEQNGLGDAIRYARNHVGNEPFAVLLGDTIIDSDEKYAIQELIDVYNRFKAPVVALEAVPKELVSRYGVIAGDEIDKNVYMIRDLVEKPSMEEAPSNLAIASRYVLTPEIFDYLDRTPRGKNNELQLTDALASLVKKQAIYGVRVTGNRYDVGNKLDFIKTNIAFGLKRPDINESLRDYIKSIAENL